MRSESSKVSDEERLLRRKVVTALCIVLLAALAVLGWYEAWSIQEQSSAACKSFMRAMANAMAPPLKAVKERIYTTYEQTAIVLGSYFSPLARCPGPPEYAQIANLLNRVTSFAIFDHTLWDPGNATALQMFGSGLQDVKDFVWADQRGAAIDRLQQLIADLQAMGFWIPG